MARERAIVMTQVSGAERAGIVRRAALPRLEEHLLEHVLGGAAIAERAHEEPEHGAAALGVQRGERVGVAAVESVGEAEDMHKVGTEQTPSWVAPTRQIPQPRAAPMP